MPPHDDDQFQAYLKHFQPLVPDPLPVLGRKPHLLLRLLAATAVIAFTMIAGMRDWKSGESQHVSPVGPIAKSETAQPLTLARVNAVLAQPQSFKTSLDEIALNSSRLKLSEGQKSALGVLGKEKKL
jgi:hypothetical protein